METTLKRPLLQYNPYLKRFNTKQIIDNIPAKTNLWLVVNTFNNEIYSPL